MNNRRFQALIEREWLQAGHPFFDRCAHGPFRTCALQPVANVSTFKKIQQGVVSAAYTAYSMSAMNAAQEGSTVVGAAGVAGSSLVPGSTVPFANQLLELEAQTLPCAGVGAQSGANRAHCVAPTFLLWLDAVWQLCTQFAASFEFSPGLLEFLAEQAYCSEYSNFLGNNERDRELLGVRRETRSIWSHPALRPQPSDQSTQHDFLNPFYEPNATVLIPNTSPFSIVRCSIAN